jgi:RimJ/RimL family protein N-acetyltransferase
VLSGSNAKPGMRGVCNDTIMSAAEFEASNRAQAEPSLTTGPEFASYSQSAFLVSEGSAPAFKLRFESFDERFCEKSWEWLNDPEIKRLTMTPDFTREDQKRWFANLPQAPDYKVWGLSFDGVPIGALGLKKITLSDAEYLGYIGERRFWGLGLGREMMRFALDQARALGLREVFLRVRRDNTRAIALYVKSGFQTRQETCDVLVMFKSLTECNER